MENLTERLEGRVAEVIPVRDAPPEWGNALMSTTPTPLAIRDLALRTQALEEAVRELAFQVQKLTAQS
jgi:hypothetical protein